MHARFVNAENSVIQLALEDGESFGAYRDAQSVFIPCEDDHPDYRRVLAEGLVIEPYGSAPAPEPAREADQ